MSTFLKILLITAVNTALTTLQLIVAEDPGLTPEQKTDIEAALAANQKVATDFGF